LELEFSPLLRVCQYIVLNEVTQSQNVSSTELSLALYQQAEQKLVEDAATLPLWFGRNYILVKPYVKGYSLSPLGLPSLNKVSIESD